MCGINRLFDNLIVKTILFLFLCVNKIQADTIILKNGEVFKGKIITQNQTIIKLKTSYTILPIKKIEIKNVIYERPKNNSGKINVFTTDKKVYRGMLIEQNNKLLCIKTGRGIFKIKKQIIEQVNWKQKLIIPPKSNADLKISSVWRSTLFPGWGQFYQKRTQWGFVYSGLILTCITSSILAYNKYKTAKDDYLSHVHDDVRLSLANSRKKTYNILIINTGILWLWQVLDTIIFAPIIEDKRTIISIAPIDMSGIGLTVTRWF